MYEFLPKLIEKIRKSFISKSGRRFQGFSMRAIDFSHENTPNESFWRKNFAKNDPNGGFFCNTLYFSPKLSILFEIRYKFRFRLQFHGIWNSEFPTQHYR